MTDTTSNFYDDLTKKANARLEIEKLTAEFFANDGHITEVPNGLGALKNGTPPKLFESYSLAGKRGARNNNIAKGYKVSDL